MFHRTTVRYLWYFMEEFMGIFHVECSEIITNNVIFSRVWKRGKIIPQVMAIFIGKMRFSGP
jgi:hypothetical protein